MDPELVPNHTLGNLSMPAEEVCGIVMHSILGRGHATTAIPTRERPVSAVYGKVTEMFAFR
jgi:hypothetical protein